MTATLSPKWRVSRNGKLAHCYPPHGHGNALCGCLYLARGDGVDKPDAPKCKTCWRVNATAERAVTPPGET